MKIGNVNLMKQINLDNLRRVMRLERKATKPELSKLTGLSVVTINSLIEILLERGEILIEDEEISKGGRPATVYSFNEKYSLALILYGNEKNNKDLLNTSVVNLYGKVIESSEEFISKVELTSFDEKIELTLKKYPNIKVIGMGLPGQEINGVMKISDYKGLEGRAFSKYLKEKFNLPVILENDINSAILGYCMKNNLEDKIVVGIWIPEKYPLGSGICIKGELYSGANNFAGEIKFLPSDINWHSPDLVSKNIGKAIKNLIATFTSIINPDLIVIYRENLTEEVIDLALLECKKDLYEEVIPKVIIAKSFSEDFETGIKELALRTL